ncbi:hypothetical protein RF11_01952 [Thelohanellus kitauei]|uniref:Uncharacterized protein n=1 Tax=Thelohanellus kitauei TaxID=669202 RepID=A0A0C2ML51_THEKT|nr:hypothetical protein RF11_01952 [Thelohanellus kitauei]
MLHENNAYYRPNSERLFSEAHIRCIHIQDGGCLPSPLSIHGRKYTTGSYLDEMKYNLEYFSRRCDETFPTINFTLRVHPQAIPFAKYELFFIRENHERFLELEDDNGYLNLHIHFKRRGSAVFYGFIRYCLVKPTLGFEHLSHLIPTLHEKLCCGFCKCIFIILVQESKRDFETKDV